ncbi:MAG: NPXTG-anchored protein, partial [Ruminococcus sp.]|nr:NPXTG-anchored protein [Ruminococcus sp.]
SDSKEISIGNGGTARLVADNGETETTTTEATTTEGTTTSTTTTTTAKTTASSTTAKATTAANSPKTGVAFPAIAIAGVGAAVATAFVLRKKED